MTDFIKPAAVAKRTRIYFVIDRSGSMQGMATDAIGGFNSYVASQRDIEGEVLFTLALFDHEYLTPYKNVPIAQVEDLTSSTFVPRGSTALYDAVGLTVSTALEEAEAGDLVMISVLTDGGENGSKEHSHTSVQELMKKAQEERGFKIFFVAANMNATSVGASMGFRSSNTATYQATGKGMADAMNTVHMKSASYRGITTAAAAASMDAFGEVDMSTLYSTLSAVDVKAATSSKIDLANLATVATATAFVDPSLSKTVKFDSTKK